MKLAAVLLLATIAAAAAPAAKTISVELGKEFLLRKGEIAAIAGTKASVRITKFINSPCPKGVHCVWSGQAVYTELTVDGKVVPSKEKNPPFVVAVKKSDYKTYAVLLVTARAAAP